MSSWMPALPGRSLESPVRRGLGAPGLGSAGGYRRASILEDEFCWLRIFADRAAIVIANGDAFAEIERLRHPLEAENAYLREEVDTALAFGSMVGRSPALRKILPQIELVARTEATVLILGESGTGSERA